MRKKSWKISTIILVTVIGMLFCFNQEASAWRGRCYQYCYVNAYSICSPRMIPDFASSSAVYYHGARTALFNGKDLSGWTDVSGKTTGLKWEIKDGSIYQKGKAGDLYLSQKYENFILEFDFKVSPNGNSGVKYKSWSTSGYGLGCEYQILDTPEENKVSVKQRTASLYDVIPTRLPQNVFKSGEFNHGKIIVMGNHVEHWINGQLSVAYDIGSPDWNAGVAASKFAKTPEFGTVKLGRIFLQDHNDGVWFKNLYITKLNETFE